ARPLIRPEAMLCAERFDSSLPTAQSRRTEETSMEPQSFTRRQLYELVWKEPIQKIAPKFGLSDRGLAKLCERHGVPTPPRGYRARKQAGQKTPKAPLIELEGSRVREDYPIAKIKSVPLATDEQPNPLLTFWQEQKDEIGDIKVARTL